MDEKHLRHPLLPLAGHADTAITTSASTATDFVGSTSIDSDETISTRFGLSSRLLVIFLTGVISVWASHEASKGFAIRVVNNMEDTPAGEKFTLFYVSNDEAIRLVQSSSVFAARILFPGVDRLPEKKLIDQVDVQLVSSHNLTSDHTVAVKSFGQKSKYIFFINPRIMEFGDFRYRIRKEIQKGMAEILLFNRQHTAPKLEGMAEYISDLAGFGSPKPVFKLRDVSAKCWEEKDSRVVAKFLAYCEKM